VAAKQNLANTRTQRTKDKETLKKKYRRTDKTAVATNTTSGQQKKHGEGGHSKQATQTKATRRAGPAQKTVAKDAKEEQHEARDGGEASTE